MPRLVVVLSMLLALGAMTTSASAAPVEPFELRGPTLRGPNFDLKSQQGRVVMVVYWSTGCAVCRDKLPELRRNLAGWAHQPFDLVMVSLDKSEGDWRRYEQLLAITQPKAAQRGVTLWGGSPGFSHSLHTRPTQLPLTLVFGPDGREHLRVAGRIPPEAWDTVAELLP
jgi:hypothetical protein